MIEICFDFLGSFLSSTSGGEPSTMPKCIDTHSIFREICVMETIILSISILIMCVNAIWWLFSIVFFRLRIKLAQQQSTERLSENIVFYSLLLFYIGIHPSMIKNSIFININRKNYTNTLVRSTPQSVAAAKPNNIQKVSRYEFFTSYAHFYYSYYMQHYIFHLLCIHSLAHLPKLKHEANFRFSIFFIFFLLHDFASSF